MIGTRRDDGRNLASPWTAAGGVRRRWGEQAPTPEPLRAAIQENRVGRNQSMAIKFAATMNAINRGLEGTKADKGSNMVEDWEAALSELDVPGSKGILRDLTSLRKQLEKSEPDAERVNTLLHRLGEATVKIAEKATGHQEKLTALGEALIEAGDATPDEAEDTEAAANPKRKTKKS